MNIENIIKTIGINAKKAAHELVNIDSKKKNDSFLALKNAILDSEKDLIEINKKDIDNAINSKLSSAMIDRLTLNHERIFAMANGLDDPTELGFRDKMTAAKELLDRSGLVKTEKMQVESTGGVMLMPVKQTEEE